MPAARNVQVTLAVTNGVLTLAGTTGLTVSGNGTAHRRPSPARSPTSTPPSTAWLFAPTGNFNGSANLTVTTNDQGNTGSGGAQTDIDTVAITVNAVNDAPVNTVPAAQAMNEDGTLTFSAANGNAISIADVDAGGSNVQVTLAVTNGVLTLAGTDRPHRQRQRHRDGHASPARSPTSTPPSTAWLFPPTGNFNGSANLTVTTNDQGNTGSGGAQTDIDTVAITVSAVNDAPVNTCRRRRP